MPRHAPINGARPSPLALICSLYMKLAQNVDLKLSNTYVDIPFMCQQLEDLTATYLTQSLVKTWREIFVDMFQLLRAGMY